MEQNQTGRAAQLGLLPAISLSPRTPPQDIVSPRTAMVVMKPNIAGNKGRWFVPTAFEFVFGFTIMSSCPSAPGGIVNDS